MTTAPIQPERPTWWTILPFLAFAQALIATTGSLFFSEVLKFAPCVLCWYQRILMYPLVIVLAVGILLRDRHLRLYVLPLSILGLAIATFHNLLYFGVIPEEATQCVLGVSCTTRYLALLGFVDIPVMSFAAFAVITVAMLLHRPEEPDHGE